MKNVTKSYTKTLKMFGVMKQDDQNDIQATSIFEGRESQLHSKGNLLKNAKSDIVRETGGHHIKQSMSIHSRSHWMCQNLVKT